MGSGPGGDAFIALRGVSKAYRRGTQDVPVLDKVDLEIQAGAFEAIMSAA